MSRFEPSRLRSTPFREIVTEFVSFRSSVPRSDSFSVGSALSVGRSFSLGWIFGVDWKRRGRSTSVRRNNRRRSHPWYIHRLLKSGRPELGVRIEPEGSVDDGGQSRASPYSLMSVPYQCSTRSVDPPRVGKPPGCPPPLRFRWNERTVHPPIDRQLETETFNNI